MRISAQFQDSNTGGDGSPILSSFNVYDMDAPGRTWTFFSTRNERYRGFTEQAENLNTGGVATWGAYGPYPRSLVATLTEEELTLSYPTEEAGQLIRWISYPRVPSLSSEFTPEPAVLVSFYDTAASPASWFGPGTPGADRVRVGSGAVWVLTLDALTLLDFTKDKATLYGHAGGRVQVVGGLDPSSVGDLASFYAPTSDPSLAVPATPYRAVAPFARKDYAVVAVGGGSSVVLLTRDFTDGSSVYRPESTHDFGVDFQVHSLLWLSESKLLAVGRQESTGSLWYSIREGETGAVLPEAVWCDPHIPFLGLEATAPRVARNQEGYVWATADRAVFRWTALAREVTCSTRVDFWAGFQGDDLGVDPRFRSIDPCERIIDIAFTDDIPGVLLECTAAQGGGSFLDVFDPVMRQVLYRRRYRSVARSLGSSPLRRPQSPMVVPGVSNFPPPGYGPD